MIFSVRDHWFSVAADYSLYMAVLAHTQLCVSQKHDELISYSALQRVLVASNLCLINVRYVFESVGADVWFQNAGLESQ